MNWTPKTGGVSNVGFDAREVSLRNRFSANNDIRIPGFILSRAPFHHHSGTKMGTKVSI